MKTYLKFLVCISIPLTIGAIGGIATASSVKTWYLTLNKPVFNPPNYLFGPVWTLLYILMGISLYIISKVTETAKRNKAFIIFGIQLTLNLLWSFLFFKWQLVHIAFIEIIAMWISIIIMIIYFNRINKTAGYLQIPYLLWVSFASVLNGAIWFLN